MLNTTSNTSAQLTSVANVLLYPTVETIKEPEVGYIFTARDFAKNWDSVCFRPKDLNLGEACTGMRRLTSPTLVITSHSNSMAFIIASEKAPVYIPAEFDLTKEGYIIAARLAPTITPDYIFYMCQNELWNQIINWYTEEDGFNLNWKQVGIIDYDAVTNQNIVLTPLDLIRNVCQISLPTIAEQKAIVANAKEQEAEIAHLVESKYDVRHLVNHYMLMTRAKCVFGSSQLGLLLECYLIAAGDAANSRVKEILSAHPFEKGIINDDEMVFLSQHLEELFQSIISANDIAYQPISGFIQPQEVTNFMCEIASFPKNAVVYNPFSGANSYAVALSNTVEGEENNADTWAIGQIRLFAVGATPRTNIKLGDSFLSMDETKKYKAIISSPVYTHEKGQQIGDIVGNLYDKLEDGGTLACIVTTSFLFQQSGISKKIRERLIGDKAVKAIITLPSNIFAGTDVSQSAIVLTKGIVNEYVVFADASGYTRFAKSVYRQTTFDWEQFLRDMENDIEDYWDRGSYVEEGCISVPLTYDKIVDTDLTPARYLVPEFEGIKLSELATEVSELRGKEDTAEYFITSSSIPAAMHHKPFIPNKSGNDIISTAKNYIQIPGDAVILAMVSGEPRTVYTENFNSKIAFPGGFIKVFKPTDGVSAKYLAALMSAKPVADQIKALCAGTVIPRLNRLNISSVIVPNIESTEMREKLISEIISSEMSDLEGELQRAYDSRKREVRSTRHAMIQTLSALSSNWEQLRMFSDSKGGKIDTADVIGRINPISVEKLMDSIGYAISTLERQVESLRFEKTDWGAEIEINPYTFINDYICTHSTPHVRMVNMGKENVADFPYFDDETGDANYYHTDAAEIFYAPAKLLERIFNNIVANANAHGFTDYSTNNEIRFDWMSENGNIVITIANNGRPLKEGVSGDDVLMNGFSTALNKDTSDGTIHSGHGGYEIKTLMEGIGNVQIISEPDSEFPVIYKLTFEKTNFETIDIED